jgi:hypothetical protein
MRLQFMQVKLGLGVVAVAALSVVPTTVASAQVRTQACGTYPALACPTPSVTSVPADGTKPADGSNPVAAPAAAASSGTLPFTGSDIVELGGIGLAAIGVGAVLVRRSRTRHSTD